MSPQASQAFDDAIFWSELVQCATERAQKSNGSKSSDVAPPPVVRYCDCPELVINGERQASPAMHDCQYVWARSALVAEACRIANAKVCDRVGDKEAGYRWTKEFVKVMDELANPLLNGQSEGGQHEPPQVEDIPGAYQWPFA